MAAKYFVGGLNPMTTTESMLQYFEPYGQIVDCVVMIKDGRSRCFGFVTFADGASISPTFASQAHVIDGKQVDVKIAVPPDNSAQNITKIFVGGLSPNTGTEQLQEYFGQFGTIVDVVAIVQGGYPRGFGFVQYSTPEEAAAVLAYPGHVIDGRTVELKLAEPKGSAQVRAAQTMYGAPFLGAAMQPMFGGAAFGVPRQMGYKAFSPAAGAGPVNSAKVFVGGLPPHSTEDSLTAYFSQFGTIAQCEVMRREDGTSRGFGFIVFANPHEGSAAVASHYHEVDGKVVEVKKSLPKGIAPPALQARPMGMYSTPRMMMSSSFASPVMRRPALGGFRSPLLAQRYRPY